MSCMHFFKPLNGMLTKLRVTNKEPLTSLSGELVTILFC